MARLAIVLAVVALGSVLYAKFSDDRVARAVGVFAGTLVLLLLAWWIKSILARIHVANDSEGLEILAWLVAALVFFLLYLAIGLGSLSSP